MAITSLLCNQEVPGAQGWGYGTCDQPQLHLVWPVSTAAVPQWTLGALLGQLHSCHGIVAEGHGGSTEAL